MTYRCTDATCPMAGIELPTAAAEALAHRCPRCGGALTGPPSEPRPETVVGDLQRLVLERFPFPIAYGYRRIVEPESALRAEECLFYTYSTLLQFGTLVFLGQFLASPVPNPHAAKSIRGLRNPCIANWFTGLTSLSQQLFPVPANGLPFPGFAQGGPFSTELVVAARKLAKFKHEGVSLHDQLRTTRNHIWGHGTIREEGDAARRLPRLRELLDTALGLFSCLAGIELLRRSPGGMIRLVGAEDVFPEEAVTDPRLEDLFEDSETVLRNAAGEFLPLYPLFLGGEPLRQGYSEPLLSFIGHGQDAAFYLGVRSRSERQDVLSRYLDLLRAKDIDPRFTKAELAPWNVTQWARESSLSTVDNLRNVKYFPDFYTERRVSVGAQPAAASAEDDGGEAEETGGVDDTLARWLDLGREAALIVAAEAGAGKTSLFCRTAETLLARGGDPTATLPAEENEGAGMPAAEAGEGLDCVLLVLGGSVRSENTLFGRIREGLGFSDDVTKGGVARFDELLDAWLQVGEKEDIEHANRRLVLLVDAANEAQDPKKLFQELSDLAAQAATANGKAAQKADRQGRAFVRLVVSVRAERIETLLERWQETGASNSAFLENPHNFAQFPDRKGKPAPYLALRGFTADEARQTYGKAQAALAPRRCPAAWDRLAPATRELLRHPLLLRLFHEGFAGNTVPPSVTAADAVWGAWLARTFDPVQGGTRLEEHALDLAEACIDGGHDAVPAELASAWRVRWQVEQQNDPARIAAGMDPLERLTEAGLLRESEAGGLDWVSDSLAEQVLFRALQRRDPGLTEESLAAWGALPPSRRLDGALVHAGVACWREGRPAALGALLDVRGGSRWRLVGRVLAAAAPRGPEREVAPAAEAFGRSLGELTARCDGTARCDRLKYALLWDVTKVLKDRWGAGPALRQTLLAALGIAEKIVALKPDNTAFLRDLSVSYIKMGDLDGRRDPAQARAWCEKALGIAEKLAAQEPDNTAFLRDLSLSYERMGTLDGRRDPAQARVWHERSLVIREKLAALKPDDTHYLRGLSVSYGAMGKMDEQRDPAQARVWHEKSLGIAEKLAALEPDNTLYLRDLSVSYFNMGALDGRRDPAQARVWHEKGLGIAEKLAALEPNNTSFLRDLGSSYRKMGDMTRMGPPEEAGVWYRKAVEVGKRLAGVEESNPQYWDDLAFYCSRLGSHLEAGDTDEAVRWFCEAKDAAARLAQLDPSAERRQELTRYVLQLARLEAATAPDRAWKRYEEVLSTRKALSEEHPRDPEVWVGVASVLSIMAERLQGQGRIDEEREYSARADEAVGRAVALKPDAADIQYALACTRARLGRTADALAALTRSAELGDSDADHAAQDSDLRALRGLPEFEAILERMRTAGTGGA